jgi:hypothetical protein
VGFSKVLNFSTSAACPENVYVHGNYNAILKNLLLVTVANSLPPLLRRNFVATEKKIIQMTNLL